jgi:hypothetical protein
MISRSRLLKRGGEDLAIYHGKRDVNILTAVQALVNPAAKRPTVSDSRPGVFSVSIADRC